MWFDSHCHLHLCAEGAALEEVVQRARSAQVEEIVTVGIDAASSRAAQEIAARYELWFTAGVHPNSASQWGDGARTSVESLVADARCVAVGETGLDFYRDGAPRPVQAEAFRAHIRLAKDNDKALVIHTRQSLSETLDELEAEGPPDRFVFHCWSGSELDRALGLGAFISFAGNVSFPNAEDLRGAARRVPSDRLLVETDAPFLSPVPQRGRPNEPARVAFVGAAVAAARDETVEEVARRTRANARRLFGLPA